MRHARVLTLLACLFAATLAPNAATAAIDATGPLASDSGPIRPRRQVPDDPLAGLPSEDSDRPGRGKGGGKSAALCKVDGTAANARDIGDLRAALAFVQRGPTSWPCPARVAGNSVGLRITVDGAGKITAVEATASEAALAASIAKKLTGKSIAPRAQGSTTGTVLLTFKPGKGR
jgi:hypothetical protein